ncbi:MAG: hypothetical protein KAS13_08330 [Candidatus Omnitrophica bacterium]|nr:hypothetical protein [Candidatus Omnitrophota bacterium]
MAKSGNKCGICERKARRLCPILEKMICSSCCGSKRGTEISCSRECEYYPFSIKGYDLWLKIDEILAQKIMSYVIPHYGREKFEKVLESMIYQDEPTEHTKETAAGAAIYYLLFVKKDHRNQTLALQWKNQGWQGLTNDERMMLNCRIDNSYATIIEIQKILDYQAMECIDLLDPKQEKFILFDRSIVKSISRFTQLITWINHYPHFSRMANNAIEVPDMICTEFMNTLREAFKKDSLKRRQLTIKQYLSENFGSFCRLNFELTREKTKAMVGRMDIHQCKAMYTLKGKVEEVKAVLDKYPEFSVRDRNPEEKDSPGACYYQWLRRGESKKLEAKMLPAFRHKDENLWVGTVGNIILYPDNLIIETFSKQKYVFAKKMIKKYFKELVVLKNEAVIDMAKQHAETIGKRKRESATEKSNSIPPEIERKLMRDFYKNRYEKFLDEDIPALDGMTPRQAAKKPAMKIQLINLMKLHIKGIEKQNRDKNLGLNIDWLLNALGLTELI